MKNEEFWMLLITPASLVGMFIIVKLIRWINDANVTGWRLRRWHDRGVSQENREWKEWFAWRPVRTVSGELVWWATVYRQLGNDYTDQEDWNWYYYGTIFDVLANGQKRLL